MICRPFDFPDSKEGQVRARLTFDGDHLATIVNMENNRQFGFFRTDPRLITMISSPNGEQRLFVPRSGFPDLLVDTLLAKTAISTSMMESVSTPSDVRCWGCVPQVARCRGRVR